MRTVQVTSMKERVPMMCAAKFTVIKIKMYWVSAIYKYKVRISERVRTICPVQRDAIMYNTWARISAPFTLSFLVHLWPATFVNSIEHCDGKRHRACRKTGATGYLAKGTAAERTGALIKTQRAIIVSWAACSGPWL